MIDDKPKRKRGPQANAGNRKSRTDIYMTEDKRALLLAEAVKMGLSLSKFLVYCAEQYLKSK